MRTKIVGLKATKSSNLLLRQHAQAWLPIILAMTTIFILSAQPKYGPSTSTTGIYFSGFFPVFPGIWETIIKKSWNGLMYAALSGLAVRACLREGLTLPQA